MSWVRGWRGALALITAIVIFQAHPRGAGKGGLIDRSDESSTMRASALVRELVTTTYPELAGLFIDIREFRSESDYFRTAFAFRRYFFGLPMHYVVRVNPEVWTRQAPEHAIRAILVHELAHVYQLSRGMRVRRFGLVKLVRDKTESRFERWADLQAIERGHADGLRAYREWLYRHVPAKALPEKQRHYFSPAEIGAMVQRAGERPERFAYWRRHVPLSLADIEQSP